MTDEKTAAALAARSERAVADVIARYSRHLYTVAAAALRGVGTEQDAEEAAADPAESLWLSPEERDEFILFATAKCMQMVRSHLG